MPRLRFVRLLSFAVAGGIAALAQTNSLVAPNSNAGVAGNATSTYAATPTSVELQELIGSGQFATSPITITGISFRAAPGMGPVNVTIPNLTLTLSTSPNYPNTSGTGKTLMSSTFANNVGPDATVVFSGSNVVLKDSGCAAPGPCPFDLNIVFQKPFTYSSSKVGGGQLLLDFVDTNLSGTSGALDAESFTAPGGSVATVLGAAGSPTGTFAYEGPIVQISYTTSAPLITAVVNVASNIPSGMPNYGIAQGSLFAVYGSNLGPANLVAGTLPLPTTGLAGTSISINVNGTTVTAPIFFTRTDIVVAVMPSNTPTGSGDLGLSYNGNGSAAVTVAQSNFGISYNLTPNANNGIGVFNTAAVTLENYQSVTTTNTAKPGDTLVIWGTGLGATPNGNDITAAPAGNIGPAPLVFVGGVQSPSVTYWGRSPATYPGLDQINFVVPSSAPLGCNVSVVVQTANGGTPVVSNAPTIALAATDGATCSDPTQFVPSSALSLNNAKVIYIATKENISVSINPNGSQTQTASSYAETLLFEQTQAQIAELAGSVNVEPSFGSCYVGITANPNGGSPPNATFLNAGSTITLTPPSGPALTLTSSSGGELYQSSSSSQAIPSGTWSFSDGSGGPDVGPLSFNFPVPQPVTWSNQSTITGSTIARTNPLTITWTGGDSNGYVDIQGFGQAAGYYVGFECSAPVSAGQLVIPSSILLAMPPGAGAFSSLQVSTIALPNILGSISGFTVSVTGSKFQTQVPVIFN
ncbi:MAG TPA: hypothetical protein VK419_08000 [Bryobacteraceae bacterium]|nr:hypothetical protein [Bryobacteraceae bacterium]